MDNYKLARYLNTLRERSGLSRFDLAKRLNLNYITIAKWENGETRPTRKEIEELSAVFGVSVESFIPYGYAAPAAAPAQKSAPIAASLPKTESVSPVASQAQTARKDAPAVKAPTAPVETASNNASVVEEPIARTTATPTPENVYKTVIADSSVGNTTPAERRKMLEAKYEENVSSYRNGSVRVRRIFAFILDSIIAAVVSVIVALMIGVIMTALLVSSNVVGLATIGIATMFSTLALIFRDVVLGGTSLGKLIFGLRVVDKVNAARPVFWQRVVRALSAPFITTPDAIVMLITGRSVGDYIAGTCVVSRRSFIKTSEANKENGDLPVVKRKNRVGVTLVVIVAVLLCIALFVVGIASAIKAVLENEKSSEEYMFAYAELTESEKFLELDVDPDELTFISFSRNVNFIGGESVTNVEYTFESEDYLFYVYVISDDAGMRIKDIEIVSFVLE